MKEISTSSGKHIIQIICRKTTNDTLDATRTKCSYSFGTLQTLVHASHVLIHKNQIIWLFLLFLSSASMKTSFTGCCFFDGPSWSDHLEETASKFSKIVIIVHQENSTLHGKLLINVTGNLEIGQSLGHLKINHIAETKLIFDNSFWFLLKVNYKTGSRVVFVTTAISFVQPNATFHEVDQLFHQRQTNTGSLGQRIQTLLVLVK
mmetsp:Transcript_26304/g.54945  ORF Transcript_26304/g.54945 Transcript_26304/m.54945 type:complete len:205 (-) Transcript_26304:1471-2085(-)